MRKITKRLISVCTMIMLLPISVLAEGTEAARQYCSGTLPIMFINTEGPVTTKEYYINATCYIDALGQEGYESLGTAEAPLPLAIKGHGNHTWREYDKKPYRLKFNDKVNPLGMGKNRHFTLLPHVDDDLAYLRNTVGFELSRLIGMAYTPAQEPVEVVFNGDYVGLYMLTDKIRLGKNRVEITQQEDLATDPEEITGGWLLEIDNYEYDDQIYVPDPVADQNSVNMTIHDPEVLSREQRSYITDFIEKTDAAIRSKNRTNKVWERYIDMDTLARYYIVREIVDDAESFRGSCYIHKDRKTGDEETKLIFGPVWDFGNAFQRWAIYGDVSFTHFIYEQPTDFANHWIEEIAKYPHFQRVVMKHWRNFYRNGFNGLNIDGFINEFVESIKPAFYAEVVRWPQYDINIQRTDFRLFIHRKIDWLNKKWGLDYNSEPLESTQ